METFFDPSKHPKIKLTVSGNRKIGILEALVDTGFDGYLSLPINVAILLGLELIGVEPVQYADGRTSQELVFSVKVNFDGKEKIVVTTLTAGSVALAGTSLFSEHELKFNFPQQKITLKKV